MMIYTVTLNPSLDYIMYFDEVHTGQVNRSKKEDCYFGGKGINVSIVLKNLGIASKALGFIAGFTGKEIERGVQEYGIESDFIWAHNGMSRINVKVKEQEETELNARGPQITNAQMQAFLEKITKLEAEDILVLAGAVPSSLPSDTYEKILQKVAEKKVKTVIDATGDLLKKCLPYHPFLIKPNKQELEEFFSVSCTSQQMLADYGKKFIELGARNVLLSLGEEGAILITEEGKVYYQKAPKGRVINSTGAGDSALAGFLASYIRQGDAASNLAYAVAAGSASAFMEGLAGEEEISRIYLLT